MSSKKWNSNDPIQNPQPSKELCSKLYDTLDRLKKLKPWNYLCEVDICEVQLPDAPEVYYCSFCGMFEVQESLMIYYGRKGLVSLISYLKAEKQPEYVADNHKNCMECLWTARENLKNYDRETIRLAEKKYRGAGNWPCLRRYETGYQPYFCNEDDLELFTMIAEELCNAIEELMTDRRLYKMREGERIHRRYNQKTNCWENHLLPSLEQVEMVTDGCIITDELLLRRMKKKKSNGRFLEFDALFLPVPMEEVKRSGRYRYPELCILCDADRGAVEGQHFIDPFESTRDIILGMLIHYIETKGRPQCVYVRNPEMFGILNHLCEGADIGLELSPMLKMLDFFVEDLIGHLSGV